MRYLCGLPVYLLLIIGDVFSSVRASEYASVRWSDKESNAEENVDARSFLTTDQKRNLKNSFKSGVKDLILQRKYESTNSRFLEEGDWDFINDIIGELEFEVPLDLETELAGIDFTIGSLSCNSISFDDIITEGSGSTTEYNLSFRVTGITVSCSFDYEYSGGFLIGSGSGNVDASITDATFVETELIFISPNFDESGPVDAVIACSANIDIGDISFGDFFLDLLLAPLLPPILEPIVEPLICDTIAVFDEALSDGIMSLNEILEEFTAPLPPELTNNLYPEQQLNETLILSTVPFVDFAPIIEDLTEPLEELISNLTDGILELNGTLAIPLELPITENITLNEIRILGLETFDFDILSLIGQYTLSTQYEQEYVGIEIELSVMNEDGTTDIVLVTSGINELMFDFALLLVLEDVSDDIPWLEDPALALEYLDCILNTIYAIEIAGFSLGSGSFEGLEISGFSDLLGPQQLINEVSEAIFFMFDSVLSNALTNFFERDVRSAINDVIQPQLPTCLEKLSNETLYIPIENQCLKIELFDGGFFASDTSNSECGNEVYTSRRIFSQFDYIDGDKVLFKRGGLGFKGEIMFIEDSSLPEIDFLTVFVNKRKKNFSVNVTLPTCTTSCYS